MTLLARVTHRITNFEITQPQVRVSGLMALAFTASAFYSYALAFSSSFKALVILGLMIPAIVFVIWKPEYLAVVLLGIAFGQINQLITVYGISFPNVALGVAWFMLVFHRFLTERKPFVRDHITWWLFAYLLVVAAGLWYAMDAGDVEARLEDLIWPLLAYPVLINVLSESRVLRRGIWSILIVGGLIGGLTLYQEVTRKYDNSFGGLAKNTVAYISQDTEVRPRAAGATVHPNQFGLQMVVFIPLGLWALTYSKTWRGRISGGLLAAACFSGLILSFSRGAYLAVLVVGALFLIYTHLSLRRLPLIVGLVIGLAFIAPPEATNRFLTLNELVSENSAGIYSENGFLNRTVYFRMGLQMFVDYPILGVGARNFHVYYPAYIRANGSPVNDEERDPHDMYVEVLAEHGLIGSLIVGILIFQTWTRLITAQRLFNRVGNQQMSGLAMALQLSLLGYMLAGLFIHATVPMCWLLQVALAVAIHAAAQQEVATSQKVQSWPFTSAKQRLQP